MKRKELEKLSDKISEAEVIEKIKAYGGQWVILGEDNNQELIHIIDNDVFNKFEAMDYMEDDEVWAYTKIKYLMKSNLKRVLNEEQLSVYIEKLTEEKYG